MFHIGQRVRAVREAKEITQTYVAGCLDVVQTTVGMYEKSLDLKHGLILRLAEVLEVNHNYLTGTDSSLEPLGTERVVRRESQRLFLDSLQGLTAEERQRFERISDHVAAPKTVEGWMRFRNMLQTFLGPTPNSETISPPALSVDAAPGKPSGTPAGAPHQKKRMARISPDTFARHIRKVG